MNTVRLRLYEPPRLDAALLTSISNSLTTAPPIPGTPSPLDNFYHSNAALKLWYEEWISFPVSSYHSVPLSVALDIIHAITILGRWAKFAAPGTVRPVSSPLPPDPSGCYNNPADGTAAPASCNPGVPLSLCSGQLAHAITTLRMQLATQPGLSLDVTGILGTLGGKFEQASAMLAARSAGPQTREHNVWSLSATKLRIVQLKLEQWAEVVAEGEEGEDEEEEEEEQEGEEDEVKDKEKVDGGVEGGGEADIEMPDPGGYAAALEGLTGNPMPNVGRPQTGNLHAEMDPLLWTEGWEDWGHLLMGHDVEALVNLQC